jgi:hypothetical protein
MVDKWRPTLSNCLYIIPDINGAIQLLELILHKILPLRKSDGISDKIIFLGNYIGKNINSYKVLDRIIELKEKYKDKIIPLLGSNEWMMLGNLGLLDNQFKKDDWFEHGGLEIISGYLEKHKIKGENVQSLPIKRIKSLVSSKHIDFLSELQTYYELDEYIFTHAGYDPTLPIEEQSQNSIIWNRSLFNDISNKVKNKQQVNYDKIIITGQHSARTKNNPIILERYMMLDAGSPEKLIVFELNSMQCFAAYPGNGRLVRFDLDKFFIEE